MTRQRARSGETETRRLLSSPVGVAQRDTADEQDPLEGDAGELDQHQEPKSHAETWWKIDGEAPSWRNERAETQHAEQQQRDHLPGRP